MAFTIILEPKAARDVERAESFLSQLGSPSLQRWRTRLSQTVHQLEMHPDRFPEASEADIIGVELREMTFGRRPHIYRILFTVVGDSVHIHRIRHAARDRIDEGDL